MRVMKIETPGRLGKLGLVLLAAVAVMTGCGESSKDGGNAPPVVSAPAPSESATGSVVVAELGDKPPQPDVRIGGESVQVYQSSYCWASGCADYIGPEEMLKDKAAEVAAAGAALTFEFPGKQPTETHLGWFRDGAYNEAPLDGNIAKLPEEPGIYYFTLSAYWLKDPVKRISEGDSSYVFAVEVK